MIDSEFLLVFHSILERVPTCPRDSIRTYCAENQIEVSVLIDDGVIDRSEVRFGTKYPSVITRFDGAKWFFIFRSLLLFAPQTILTTIIQHEYAHAFLEPFFRPVADHKPPSKEARNEFERLRIGFNRLLQSQGYEPNKIPANDSEELFVSFINTHWKGNEPEAEAWIAANTVKPTTE